MLKLIYSEPNNIIVLAYSIWIPVILVRVSPNTDLLIFFQTLSYFSCDSGFRVGILLHRFQCFQSIYCMSVSERDPVTLISIKDVHACQGNFEFTGCVL